MRHSVSSLIFVYILIVPCKLYFLYSFTNTQILCINPIFMFYPVFSLERETLLQSVKEKQYIFKDSLNSIQINILYTLNNTGQLVVEFN